MKLKTCLILALFLPFAASAQKTNMFIDAGALFYPYESKHFISPLFSTVFDYVVSPEFSIGGGLELSAFSTFDKYSFAFSKGLTFGLSPLADCRYYFLFQKGAIIPIAQAGYNLYKNTAGKNTAEPLVTTSGSFQYALGLAGLFNIFKNGKGLMITVKYMNRSFKETVNGAAGATFHVSGFAPSIGIKF